MKIRTDEGTFNSSTYALRCPRCDGRNLHHERVEEFEREEDSEHGLHVTVGDAVQVDRNVDANPSPRRHGLTIHFACKDCPATLALDFVQHRGNTLIAWKR